MELVTLDEFIADLETTFSNYAATNDIDRISVKGWIIESLRKFGKNICQKREAVVEIKNSRALLPETFKSMILGLKLTDEGGIKKTSDKRLIVERQYIENPAYWSNITRDYFVDNCNSKITTERIYTHYEQEDRWFNYEWLSLEEGMVKDTIATNCLNLNPIIRNSFLNKVSITNRMLSTNFKEGKVYLQYNSLPSENDEIAIPIFSTGDIKAYIENRIKIKLAETLTINEKNSQSINQLVSLWLQQDRQLFIFAKSEANWYGLNEERWAKKVYIKNRQNQNLYNLPK